MKKLGGFPPLKTGGVGGIKPPLESGVNETK